MGFWGLRSSRGPLSGKATAFDTDSTLWCCAADARPIYIPVALSDPVDVSDMEWVKVTGTAEFSTNEGQTRVLLRADSVDASDPPDEAMLY